MHFNGRQHTMSWAEERSFGICFGPIMNECRLLSLQPGQSETPAHYKEVSWGPSNSSPYPTSNGSSLSPDNHINDTHLFWAMKYL